MKKFYLLMFSFLFLCSNSSHGERIHNSFLKEITEIKEINKNGSIDISELMKKYIKQGSDINKAKIFLKDQGFEIIKDPENNKKLVALLREKKSFLERPFGSHDEIRVIIDFSNDSVKDIKGYVFRYYL